MRYMNRNKILIIISFFIIYVVWGSTYVANIIAIEEMPPFFLVASRLTVAGVILLIITLLIGQWQWPTRKQWKNLVISSLLFLGIGLTSVVWAEQYIDSGVTALIISLEPLMIVVLLWIINRSLPKWTKFIGSFIGMFGMYLLVSQQEIAAGPEDWKGIVAIFISIISWAVGSVYISKAELPKSMFTVASIQMLISGVVILGISTLNGDLVHVNPAEWSNNTIISWGFLVVFGSILAYSAFNFLLKQVSPEKVATSTYVHPVVAVFLGWMIRGEIITFQTLMAMLVMLTGVYFINSNLDILKIVRGRKERTLMAKKIAA